MAMMKKLELEIKKNYEDFHSKCIEVRRTLGLSVENLKGLDPTIIELDS